MVLTHGHCLEEVPAENVLRVASQAAQSATRAAGHLLHCHYSVCPVFVNRSGLAHPQNRTGPNYNEQLGLQRESSRLTFPSSRTCTGLGSEKVQQLTSLQIPHILGTKVLDFYLQVCTTERYLQKNSHHRDSFFPRMFL
ncbi:hypothetical protein ILYODFUR_025634 [Ilyodon furcidens]|uniref:Uncharacterized protein n=1 Tax=Ilyodon furcidens TaxID=33524 RepID=A0ABV0TLX8_9TELE